MARKKITRPAAIYKGQLGFMRNASPSQRICPDNGLAPVFYEPLEAEAYRKQNRKKAKATVEIVTLAKMLEPRGSADKSAYCKWHAWLKSRVNYRGDDCVLFPNARPGLRVSVKFNFRSMPASRAMCIMAHGLPENPKDVARHTCGNGHLSCVNPRHLAWGSALDNGADRVLHSARPRFVPSLTRELAEEIRGLNKLSNVIAIDYGIPAAVVRKIIAREIYA